MKKTVKKNFIPYIIFGIMAIFIIIALEYADKKVNDLTYDEFEKALVSNKIEEIVLIPKDRAKI